MDHAQCIDECNKGDDPTYYKIENGLKVCIENTDCAKYIVETDYQNGIYIAQCYEQCSGVPESNYSTPLNGEIFVYEDDKRCLVRCLDSKPFVIDGNNNC